MLKALALTPRPTRRDLVAFLCPLLVLPKEKQHAPGSTKKPENGRNRHSETTAHEVGALRTSHSTARLAALKLLHWNYRQPPQPVYLRDWRHNFPREYVLKVCVARTFHKSFCAASYPPGRLPGRKISYLTTSPIVKTSKK